MTIRIRNLNAFNREVKAFGEDLMPQEHLALQKTIALDLLRRIIFRTPVDTGRARGNWQVNLGRALDQSVAQVDKNGVVALAQGASAISNAIFPYGVITIFNNVNYITFLEGGSSSQAPTGMVSVSIAETEAQF
jgi:hypothetical protein